MPLALKKAEKKEEAKKPSYRALPLAVKGEKESKEADPKFDLKEIVHDEEVRMKAGLQQQEEFEYPEYLNHY